MPISIFTTNVQANNMGHSTLTLKTISAQLSNIVDSPPLLLTDKEKEFKTSAVRPAPLESAATIA